MSKVVKGVKKIFKKVVKTIKKVAPIILAVGVIVFTAGAALGLAPLAGGWVGAVNAVTASLGTGVLGSAVTAGITQAGYGAIIGGSLSAATGGSFSKGARTGAVTGLIVGSVSGGFNAYKAGATAAPGSTSPILGGGRSLPSDLPGAGSVKTFPYPPPPPPPPSGGVGGLIRGAGKFIKDNPTLVGHAVQGIGIAIGAGAEADAERAFVRERFNQVRTNYAGTDPGKNYRGLAPGTSGQSPTERYDPRNFGSFEYRYDPEQGRIIKVPVDE